MTEPTFAVVVAFFPTLEQLRRLCSVLQKSTSVIVVDNTPGRKEALLSKDLCAWIANGENLGIAEAQNIGIHAALHLGAKSVAFFDQDSQVTDEVMPALIESLKTLGAGVVAPVCKDADTGIEYPSFRMSRLGWPLPVYIGESHEFMAVDLVISSGSLASADVFTLAGVMDNSLFIDYVDFEWCARVRKRGFSVVVVPSAVMLHSIGQKTVRTAGFHVFVHPPERCYYRVRNAVHLFSYRHVRFLFAAHELMGTIIHHILQIRYSPHPLLHVKMGLKGIKDGIVGCRGRINHGG
jgi:rhamnosyltransferase